VARCAANPMYAPARHPRSSALAGVCVVFACPQVTTCSASSAGVRKFVTVQYGLVAPIPRDTLRRPWPFDCRRPWRQTPFPWVPQALTGSGGE
jgi:hypothetical protein